jgi:hypothetical protein
MFEGSVTVREQSNWATGSISAPTSAIPGLEIHVHGDAMRVCRTGEPAPELAPSANEVAQNFLAWLECNLPARRWVQVCELEMLFEAHRAKNYHDQSLLKVLGKLKNLTDKKQRDVSPTVRSRVHYLVGPTSATARALSRRVSGWSRRMLPSQGTSAPLGARAKRAGARARHKVLEQTPETQGSTNIERQG